MCGLYYSKQYRTFRRTEVRLQCVSVENKIPRTKTNEKWLFRYSSLIIIGRNNGEQHCQCMNGDFHWSELKTSTQKVSVVNFQLYVTQYIYSSGIRMHTYDVPGIWYACPVNAFSTIIDCVHFCTGKNIHYYSYGIEDRFS